MSNNQRGNNTEERKEGERERGQKVGDVIKIEDEWEMKRSIGERKKKGKYKR